jgi:hypothetical protein
LTDRPAPEQPTPAVLARLVAKQDVADLLARYLRSIDRGDVEGLRACYLPGATEDHGGVFTGDAQAYVDSVAATLVHPRAVGSHALTNVLVEVGDDATTAVAESYVLAFARVRTPDGPVADSLTAARMVDRLRCVEGRWGIEHRTLRFDWNHDMPRTEGWLYGLLAGDTSALQRSGRFPDDPVYTTTPAAAGSAA